MRGPGRGLAQDEQEGRVGQRRPEPEDDPGEWMAVARARAGQPGHQHHAGHHHRQRQEKPPSRALTQQHPGGQRHEEHLQVPQHRGDPGPDVGDRVIPEHEIDREERSGRDGAEVRGGAARAAAAALDDGQGDQHRQGEEAAVERRGGGPGVGQLDQDRRSGQAGRAENGGHEGPASGAGRAAGAGLSDGLGLVTGAGLAAGAGLAIDPGVNGAGLRGSFVCHDRSRVRC